MLPHAHDALFRKQFDRFFRSKSEEPVNRRFAEFQDLFT